MATINANELLYDGFGRVKEKLEFLQTELFQNMETSEFKNYILNEIEKLKLLIADYQQDFLNVYNNGINSIPEYDLIVMNYDKIKDKIESIQSEIFDNLEISDFKTYIIEELSKLEMQLLDYQRTFNDLYCQNNSEKEITKNKLQEKINAINESIKHDGLSL